MKHIATIVLLALVALLVSGCVSYTFKCAKTVGFSLNPDSNPANLTGLCDGKKTVVMEGPGPAEIQHLCDKGKMHWWKNQDKMTCIDDPCVVAGKKTIFNPDGSTNCGNQ